MNDLARQQNDMHLPQPVTEVNPPVQIPVPAQPPIPQSTQSPSPNTNSQGAAAQDVDVIEQEWVHAVERTMRQHIEDPRRLATELSALKAQYLQKRFGIDMKHTPSGQGQ